MNTQPLQLIRLVSYYDPLLIRYATRLVAGNQKLAQDLVTHAMREAYDAGEFDRPQNLRLLLKNRLVNLAKENNLLL